MQLNIDALAMCVLQQQQAAVPWNVLSTSSTGHGLCMLSMSVIEGNQKHVSA